MSLKINLASATLETTSSKNTIRVTKKKKTTRETATLDLHVYETFMQMKLR